MNPRMEITGYFKEKGKNKGTKQTEKSGFTTQGVTEMAGMSK